MRITTLWQRYLLQEIFKIFFLFLLSFFSLYVLVDYSMHMQEILKNETISWIDLFVYYGMLFSKRCDLFLPLSLLISSIKVLISLNKRHELLALQVAGIPVRLLVRPFFFVGLLCVALNYYNFENLTPKALNYIDQFEQKHFKKKELHKKNQAAVYSLPLKDGTYLLYQSYHAEKNQFLDVFWIHSSDEVYHMKTLTIQPPYLVGTFVDHMKRNERKEIEKIASFANYTFPSFDLDFESHSHFEDSVENQSISMLATTILNAPYLSHKSLHLVYTHFYFKLAIPWLSILVLIGLIPFCIVAKRNHPTFLIFSLTIFGYIAFFTLMDGCVVLAELRVAPPFWAIFTLPLSFLFIFGPRFIKMCSG